MTTSKPTPAILALRAKFGPPKKESLLDKAAPWLLAPAILAYLATLAWMWPIAHSGLLAAGSAFPFPGLGHLASGIALSICALAAVCLGAQIMCARLELHGRRKKLGALGRTGKNR